MVQGVRADDSVDRDTVFVQAGDLAVSQQPRRLITVLGSCVSVCLYDQTNSWGGMNHFMHVGRNHHAPRDLRWSEPAIHDLVQMMRQMGSRSGDLLAKVFGGGNVLACMSPGIGEANQAAAQTELARHGIPIVSGSLGGTSSRKVDFLSDTGKVRVLAFSLRSQRAGCVS